MKNRNLRYYLRGLGVGIFVSVLILCLTQKGQGTMTDEQIRERAEQLGMVNSTGLVLADLQKDMPGDGLSENLSGEESVDVIPETANGETTDEAQMTESDGETETDGTQTAGSDGEIGTDGTQTVGTDEQTNMDGTVTEESDEQTNMDGTVTEESDEQTNADGTQTAGNGGQSDTQNPEITIVIQKGATSYSVSKDLETAGLIENAKTFDRYLCDEGYSKSIRAGAYTIKSGESEAEIAKIITGKR